MNLRPLGSAADSVPSMAYAPASRQADPVEKTTEVQAPSALDNLLGQLTEVLNASVKTNDMATPEALLQYLSPGGSGAGSLPPALVQLLDTVTGIAESAGRGDEFKALLREYVAVQWAISALEEIMKAQAAGQSTAETDRYYEQLAAARGFLQQLESAIARRLDKLEAQAGYTNWLDIYREDLEARQQSAESVVPSLSPDMDAAKIVAILLEAAPRPSFDQLSPNRPLAEVVAADHPANDPYH